MAERDDDCLAPVEDVGLDCLDEASNLTLVKMELLFSFFSLALLAVLAFSAPLPWTSFFRLRKGLVAAVDSKLPPPDSLPPYRGDSRSFFN